MITIGIMKEILFYLKSTLILARRDSSSSTISDSPLSLTGFGDELVSTLSY